MDNYSGIAIVATKLVPMVIGKMFIAIGKPVVPSKFFGNQGQAVAWLNSLK